MKFVLISNNLASVKNFRTDLLLDIAQLGYEIHILAPDLKDYLAEKEYLENKNFLLHEISLSRTGTNPIADAKTLLDIYTLLKKIQPAATLGYTIKPVIYGTLAAHLANVPKKFALISGLGFAFQNHSNTQKISVVKKIVNTLYKMALKRANKVFFQNSDDKKLLEDLGILQQQTSVTIVNGSGVNTDYYDHAPLIQDESGQYAASFLMVARLLHDKGIREYFNAAEIIKKQYPHVEFHLVGGLDENPASISKEELDKIVQSNTINYWGKISDVRPAIRASNIFVLPSYREGVPRSVLEAMSMGRAIITTDAPGCKETVVDGVNGFQVQVKSVDDLVTAMRSCIENPPMIAQMGKASRELALEKYDVIKVNHHMISSMSL